MNCHLITATLLVALLALGCQAHPQCFDFEPPFREDGLAFCHEYASSTCCTQEADANVATNVTIVVSQMLVNDSNCYAYIRNTSCLTCSPFAVHLFDAHTETMRLANAGLCADYCSGFYSACQNVLQVSVDGTLTLLSAAMTETEFCAQRVISDMSYCYPSGVNLQPPGPHNVTNSDDGCACVETVAAGLSNPLGLVNAQDGSGRLFIIEQKGTVRILFRNMTLGSQPFLTQVVIAGGEQGLLSMAFHPQYNVTGRVFIYYSSTEATSANHVAILSEYRVNATNPNAVDPTTERVILRIQQPYANHNGGTLLFDSKGMLLLSLGDGGAGGDPHGNGQNFNSLLGSVVRLNVSDTASPYTIPTDNPFPATPGVRPEIFAKGLRNPFRCSYDRANSSRLICGDVGQAVREEVTYVVSGGNNGWARREGFACYGDCGPVANYVPPILDYPHANGDACVIGGYVYRGCTFPGFQGKYIFGDNISGRFYIAQENATVASGWTFRELCIGSSNVCHGKSKSTHFPILMTFGEDENGELYFGATRDGDVNGATGAVYRLSDPSLRANPATCPDFISPAQLIDEFNSTSSRGNSAATMLHSVSAWSVISSVLFVLVGRVLG